MNITYEVLETIVNRHTSLRMSFFFALSFTSFKAKCCDREREASVKEITFVLPTWAINMGMYFITYFSIILIIFPLKKGNGVSLLLSSEYFRHFFLSPGR